MHTPSTPASSDTPEVFRVWLSPDASPLPAPGHQTLLQSAQEAGVELLSACRNGTCRACMLRRVQGRVRYQVEWPGLLAEEKAQGWILPCAAYPLGDLVLRAKP